MISNCIVILQRDVAEKETHHSPTQQDKQQWYQQTGHFEPMRQAGYTNTHARQIGASQPGSKIEEGQPQRPARFFMGLNKPFVHFCPLKMKKAGIVPHGKDEKREKEKGRIIRPLATMAVLLLLQSEFFLQIVDIGAALAETGIAHNIFMQRDIGFNAFNQ